MGPVATAGTRCVSANNACPPEPIGIRLELKQRQPSCRRRISSSSRIRREHALTDGQRAETEGGDEEEGRRQEAVAGSPK